MTIKFSSKINQNGTANAIDFSARVNQWIENDFTIFEFEEPNTKVMNRIEISSQAVNIFTGPSSINLLLDQEVNNELETGKGAIFYTAKMDELVMQPPKYSFHYQLAQGKNVIGDYKITMIVEGE